MTRKLSLVLATLAASLSLTVAGCGKGTDLTKVKAEAFEKASPYGPRVSGLIGRHADLQARADKLPADLAGASDVRAGLAAQRTALDHLTDLLDGYAATIDAAGKTGKKAAVQDATTAFTSELDRATADIDAALKAAAASLDTLTAAPPAPPADAGPGGAAPGVDAGP